MFTEKAFLCRQFKNLKIRPIDWDSLDEKAIQSTLQNLVKQSGFKLNVFVLGSIDTVNKVIVEANRHRLLGMHKSWYFLSKEKGRLVCATCDRVHVHLSQPQRSRLYYYEHEPVSPLPNDSNHIVDVYYNFDLAQFYLHTIDQLLTSNSLSPPSTYPICTRHLTEAQLQQREAIKLHHALSENFYFGQFGQFMFNYNSNINYQELIMKMNRVSFENGTVAQSQKVLEWEFEGQLGRLYFTSAQEQNIRPNIPHYSVVTTIVGIVAASVVDCSKCILSFHRRLRS